ncbi:hypothetical protein [Pseudoxanthomonas kalamensis]|uniref:hypothetical protein n=1 Tax=Pseudoxanthomonas kalamensis TaxID=289483 RepID=UPI00139114A0|nr:hypothetical protein [Pseudoxanthomonas kalamensis]
MSIDQIPGIQFIPTNHRCYEFALDFAVASCAIGRYIGAYHGRSVATFAPHTENGAPQYPTAAFAGLASGKNLELVPHDILTNVFNRDMRTGQIPYLVKPTFDQITGDSTVAVAQVLEGLAQSMFTRYWETNLDLIESTHGKRKCNQWPAVLQFAAVIRDAMSHGGSIHMFPSILPVSHFGLNYSQADNGRKVIHNDMSCGDIFFLMLDADAAF